MWSPAPALSLSSEQHQTLEIWSRAHSTPRNIATRADIILRAAEGHSNNAIAKELGITRVSVIQWRGRFAAEGVECLGRVRKGRGRPKSIPTAKVTEIIQRTLNTTPVGATQWSCRSMAKEAGVSPATVQRLWHEQRLYPHKVRTFKVSKDPQVPGQTD